MLVYVRPSNEDLLRARVSGAQDQQGCPSHLSDCAASASKKVVWLGWKRFVKLRRARASFARSPGVLKMAGYSVTALRR
jgi:hypothetical protein